MATATPALQEKLGRSPGTIGIIGFGIVLLVGIVYCAFIFFPISLGFIVDPSLLMYCWQSR